MKKIVNIFVFCLFLSVHANLFSQVKLYRENGIFYVENQNQKFEIDTTMVIVKFALDVKTPPNNIPIKKINKLGYADVEIPKGSDFQKFVESLKKDPSILSVEYNCYGEYLTNDPSYSNQWYLSNIQIDEAWGITRPSVNELIIAVIDGGFDIEHPDLGFGNDGFCNIYKNLNEIPYNGEDDDNNGCIDDTMGWNFHRNSNNLENVWYTFAHGTCVSGVIAAKINNNEGIAGIIGNNNNIKILPIGVGMTMVLTELIDDAIIYATDMGAKIIQMSCNFSETDYVNSAINYAIEHDVLIVCAAGNAGNIGNGKILYPATHKDVLAVGASNEDGELASFSSYGGFDVAAPGENIYTIDSRQNGSYTSCNGTSFAAPIVSGIAALVWATNPFLESNEVRIIIDSTAVWNDIYTKYTYEKYGSDLFDQWSKYDLPYGKYCNEIGFGNVNAYAAVQAAIKNLPYIEVMEAVYPTEAPYEIFISFKIGNDRHIYLSDYINDYSDIQYTVDWFIEDGYIHNSFAFADYGDNNYELSVLCHQGRTPGFYLKGVIKDLTGKEILTIKKFIHGYESFNFDLLNGVVDNAIILINNTSEDISDNTLYSSKSSNKRNAYANIYSIQNQKILTKQIDITQTTISLDVTLIPNGKYIINIVQNGNVMFNSPIIIKHK